ncbi:unnamed protein product [Adineta steineri]|uniref:Uncharacterized protein n=1 Tax=Adineta steineri TaxID=433720 RepID=A0A815Y5G4_9BILA|nr:unnamed protein product [Adineta steineri]CAF1667153.1 unnamed protein product [Adineta steineri]
MLTYRDGTAAEDNPSLKLHPNSFLIQLCSDGIGITNPLGPKKDKHKLTLYYFLLEDLPDFVKSMLQSIGLVGIYPTKFLSIQTNRMKFFEPIIKDLNHLQTTGLVVQTFNGQLHFAFSLFAADNLASNEIGGFQQSFNSGQFCRLCHISYKFRLIPLTEISFLPRTVTTHDAYVRQAVNLFNTRPVAGVVGESPLSKLIAFHAIKSLPNDLMHDYAEEEEIDGATLARLSYDEVRTLFPKLKDRILFTKKLDLLIKQCDNIANEQLGDGDILNQSSKQTFDTCTASQSTTLTQNLLNNPSLSSNNMNGDEFDAASNIDDEVNHDETDDLEEPQQNLPTDFAFSSLPEEIQVIIDENELMKLRGHTNHRRILLNFVFKAVATTYNLLYPKANDYFLITQALLKALNISTTDANAAIYVSTIMDESDVEQLIITMNEGIENETIHNDELITLWKKTFGYRRSFIRSHTINEILEKFPGYSYTHFVSLF